MCKVFVFCKKGVGIDLLGSCISYKIVGSSIDCKSFNDNRVDYSVIIVIYGIVMFVYWMVIVYFIIGYIRKDLAG